jgi:ABC-type phosphate transport system substrate-binding protein
MHARKFLAGLATTAVAASAVALSATPAFAADPDDTAGTPAATSLVTVGSDTSQAAIKLAADAYNATNPAVKIFSYAATGGGNVTLGNGSTIARPNGSTAGKNLLYSTGNNPQIAFARSSSGPSSNGAENAAGLQMFPFAVDSLVMVTSQTAASNAPTNLTPAQIVGIYDGTIKDWSAIGGKAGTIVPLIPQGGSGTRSFFEAQLRAANNNNAVTLATTVKEVQEHDPAAVQSDPNAVAPFSLGRANLAGTVHVETGFKADRALYNVTRLADASNPAYTAFMGSTGFLCSPAATSAIEAAGFRQLLSQSAGGVCGVGTQTATTNFATSVVGTATAVTVSSASSSSARVIAKVTAPSAPSGRVTFYEGAAVVQANVPLVSGQATITPAAASGAHTYRAVFTPAANSSFQGSEGTGTGTVDKTTLAASAVKAKAAKKIVLGKKSKLTVSLAGATAAPTGKVTVKLGKKTVGKGSFKNGKAKINLKPFKKAGKAKLKLTYAGDANYNTVTKTVKVKVVKAAAKK